MLNWLKNIKAKSGGSNEKVRLDKEHINFRVVVVEFADNVESNSGEIIAGMLKAKEGLNVMYYDAPFPKSFLSLESRTLFDLIDKGQDIIDQAGADVLIWGYREDNKLRLNFQADKQYETDANSFLSLMDSLYIPSDILSETNFPPAIANLIYSAVICSIKSFTKETKIQKRYLLKKTIDRLSKDSSAKSLSIEYMPYVMNFLGIIYLSYAFDHTDTKDFKIIKNLFNAAIKHQDLITNPIHLGCIYNHLGQLYDSASEYMDKKPNDYFKGAITYYRQAQKFLSKYTYPYDYGYISYKLSILFFSYWRKTEDLQALRDAVFQLREAEKIYTYALFPEFWALLQGLLGHMLTLLGNLTKSDDISELAIAAYKNQQKIITERRDPLIWAQIQEKIGDIYYRLGRKSYDRPLLEEALEYYHDALYIYENIHMDEDVKILTSNITKASRLLNSL